MSANGDSAHGFELPSASASTLMTAAAIANFSKNHGQQQQQQQLSVHQRHGRSNSKSRTNDKRASVPISAPVTATATAAASAAPPATAATTATATAAAAALLPGRRPRHQITRSITEFSPPLRMHRHRHSHHHHPTQHALHLNAQSRKDRDRLLLLDERAPGGAAGVGLGGRSSLDMTRSEYVTPSRSPDSSRRTSALVGPMIGGGENPAAAAVTPPSRRLRKVNNAAALVEEKGRTANRVAGLKNSLVELSGFSTATTRRLDETYFSVLEKKSMLQNTISAIRELTVASRQMTGDFVSEADEMARDVAGQLDTFGQFGEQESRIKQLQGRIESGRTRIEGLSGRVDLVRRRIEGWERADREWQEKTRKRLRAVWIVTSVVFAVLLLLFVGAQYLGGPADLEGAAGRALKGLERGPNRSVEGVSSGEKEAPKLSPLWEDRRGREEEEDRLRVFDEL